jgi:hypothetical protein
VSEKWGREFTWRDGFYGKRWQYHPPWTVTQSWRPRLERGSDEYDNPSFIIIGPLLGMVVFFYGRTIDRSPERSDFWTGAP